MGFIDGLSLRGLGRRRALGGAVAGVLGRGLVLAPGIRPAVLAARRLLPLLLGRQLLAGPLAELHGVHPRDADERELVLREVGVALPDRGLGVLRLLEVLLVE